MILSFKHQFIFIKTKKTGGSSIEGYLSKFLGSNDLYKTNSINLKSHHEGLYNHVGLSEFLNTKYGKYWYDELEATAKAYYEKQKTR